MTNQQAPEIYTLHTVPNKGERPWSGIYTVRADAEHDAKVMRDVTGRHWSVVRLVVADTNDRVPEAWTNVLAYVLQDELHNRLTPRVIDIAYTAFMQAKRPYDEDGRASDWFNDTRPVVRELIAKLRKDLIKELAGAPQPVPSATVALSDDLRDGLVAISKAIADQDDRAAQAMLREILAAPQPTPTSQAPFQQRVQPWLLECFGAEIAADRVERNHRFLEESLELVQSLGCTASEAHQLVDYVFGRPVGDPPQEVGGVMVTLAALCLASGLDMHDAGEVELVRISAPELVAKIRAKQAAKPKHSPLPEATTAQAAESVPAIQGEMNVQLDIDSSHSAPGQQRDVARSVPLTCEWAHNENDGFWESACGEAWRFDDGGPAENSMHFCHSCGKSLRIKGKEAGNADA